MKVRIESERHGRAEVFLDGQKAKNIRSCSLEMCVGEVNRLYIEHVPEAIQFEGEAHVIAIIDGRHYRVIEEEPLAQGGVITKPALVDVDGPKEHITPLVQIDGKEVSAASVIAMAMAARQQHADKGNGCPEV